MRFIVSSAREFLAMRDHLEKYPHTAKPFHEQDPRYVAFDNFYSSRLFEFQEKLSEQGGLQ